MGWYRRIGCRRERVGRSSINISSASQSIRTGRSPASTVSYMSACLDVEGVGSSFAVAHVRGLKYDITYT